MVKSHKPAPSLRRILLPVVLAVCVPAAAQQPDKQVAKKDDRKAAPESRFLRILRDEKKQPLSLQVSIVRCEPSDSSRAGPVVDLVSAVHVADKSYYEELNRRFKQYDAVMYELVAPEGTKVPKGGGRSTNPVSLLQQSLTSVLELEFQLKGIDYTAENLVHADMSPEQFSRTMKERGESVLGMLMRMFGYAVAKQQGSGQVSDTQLLMALFDKNRSLALKRLMAEQFRDMEGSLLAINGPKGSTIITERNKVALEVLRKQIEAGGRKFAIFYGAGHMPDFLERLQSEFHLTPTTTTWLDAWHLADPKPE
jgi:hypothetical protein